MPLERQAISSLLNGVSQQPASQRHPSQAEAVDNCMPTLAVGLEKRGALEHVAEVLSAAPSGHVPAFHFINRDPTERYLAIFKEWEVVVYDLVNDTSPTVNYDTRVDTCQSGATATGDGVAFVVAVPTGESVTLASTISATATVVWESAADEAFTSPTTLRTDTTSTSATVSWTNATDNGKWVRARISAYTSGTVDATISCKNVGYLATSDGDMRSTIRATTVADYTFVANGERTVRMDTLSVGAGSLTGTVQKFSSLPGSPSTGNIYAIEGDDTNDFDTYYVRYDGSVWVEWFNPGLNNSLDPSTMPHTLVRESDGTFTFGAASWGDRVVGDDESSAEPQFVGETIRHIVFWRNRLGMLAGEYITLSRIGNAPGGYFSFWPESVQSVLDSDPVDLGMAHNRVADLQWGAVFNESLLLLSRQTQFLMSATGVLTPTTGKVDPTTEFSASASAQPIGIGNNLYFAVSAGAYSQLREYFVSNDAAVNDAADVTAHVPKYLPGDVHHLAGSSNHDLLVALTDGDTDALYVYRYFWDGDTKAQSAWGRWTVPGSPTLHAVDFLDSDLWLVAEYSDGVYLMRQRLNNDPAVTDIGCPVLLDRRAELTGVYAAGTGLTTWTLPYATSVDAVVVLGSGFGSSAGSAPTVTQASTTTVTAVGDYSADTAYVGLPYEQRYTFSEQFPRRRDGTAIISGRLQLRRWRVRFANTGYFRVEVTPGGRDTSTYPFTGRSLGDSGLVLGDLVLSTGAFAFDIYARSGDVTIDLVNDTWMPSTFLSAEWDGLYSPRAVLPFASGA